MDEQPNYHFAGSCYEACNCDAICPCRRQDEVFAGRMINTPVFETTNASTGTINIYACMFADVAVRHPESFCTITGIVLKVVFGRRCLAPRRWRLDFSKANQPSDRLPFLNRVLSSFECIWLEYQQRRLQSIEKLRVLMMAERQGFEPWVGLHPQRFSRPPRSTTPAPLRVGLLSNRGLIYGMAVTCTIEKL